MFSLESPHRGDSNEYTQYTIFNIKKKITLNYPKSAAKGLKNEFETAKVNEPSGFEPLTVYYFNFKRKQLATSVAMAEEACVSVYFIYMRTFIIEVGRPPRGTSVS